MALACGPPEGRAVIHEQAPETWDDFAALVEVNNGVWGGCWCMGFHPEGVGAGPHPGGKPGGEAPARDARNGPPGARLRR